MSQTIEQIAINMLNAYEKEIKQYKDFHKTYLRQIFNKKLVVEDLMSILPSYHLTPSFSGVTGMSEKAYAIIYDTELMLKKYFSEDYFKLFKKSIEYKPAKQTKSFSRSLDDNLFIDILSSLKYVMDENINKGKREWEYKKQLLNYTYNCLVRGGLHPKISERNEQRFKRFNFVVIHKHMSRKEVTDYKSLISWKEFHDQYLKFYNNKKPIKMNGKIIPFDKIIQIKITTSLLLDDERELFLRQNNVIIDDKTNEANYIQLCKDETDRFHYNPFEVELATKITTEYRETQIALINYPSALKVLNEAISKMGNDALARNCLDDLRLCLELFFKEKLKNDKTLENQKSFLGKFIKENGGSVEIVNLFQKILEFYASYQNSNVKHHDKAKPGETKLIFRITSSLLIHLSELK